MNKLLKKIGTSAFLAVFILSTFLTLLVQVVGTRPVSAATTDNYIFYAPTDQGALKDLNDAIDNNHNDANQPALGKTSVAMKMDASGGGKTIVYLNLNQDRSNCAKTDASSVGSNPDCRSGGTTFGQRGNEDNYVYSGKYYCGASGVIDGPNSEPYYEIDYNVTLMFSKSSDSSNPLFKKGAIQDKAKIGWVGFGSTNTPGAQYTEAETPGSIRSTGQKVTLNKIPPICRPSGVPLAVYSASKTDSQKDGNGKLNNAYMWVFDKAPNSVQSSWNTLAKESGAGNLASGATNSGDSNSSDSSMGCDFQFTNALSWIVCPVTNILVDLVDQLDKMITNMLSIEAEKDVFCNSTNCRAYYSAWQSFRNIALGLMVLAGLVIIMSQALGLEILDAYTIRKALPRVLIAAFGISLSWPLMQLAVTFTNDLGYGVRALIYAPFNQLSGNIDLTFGGSIGTFFFGGLGSAAAVAGVAGWLMVGGIATMLAWVGTAALAVFIAIVVLVLRQTLIILMIIIAPVAIACYILPNTQKWYKLWWESFSKALLMFPLIAGFIAVGRVFSAVTFSNGGPLNQIIGFIAYFAPYFMIPLTFKFAGNILGQLGGFVNSRGEGGFNALRGIRQNQAKQHLAQLKAGERVKSKFVPERLRNTINTASAGIGTGMEGRFGLGARGKAARMAVMERASMERMKALEHVKGWNDVNRVLAMGNGSETEGRNALDEHLQKIGITDAAERQRRINTAVAAAKSQGGFTKTNAQAAFRNMVVDGTAIEDATDMANLAAIVGNGDMNSTYSLNAWAASTSKGVGRHDLASSSEAAGEYALAMSDKNRGIAHGSEKSIARMRGVEAPIDELEFQARKTAATNAPSYQRWSGDRGRSIEKSTKYWKKMLLTGNDDQKAEAAAILADDMEQVTTGSASKLGLREKFLDSLKADDSAYAGSVNATDGMAALKDYLYVNGDEQLGYKDTPEVKRVRELMGERRRSMSAAEIEAARASGKEPPKDTGVPGT